MAYVTDLQYLIIVLILISWSLSICNDICCVECIFSNEQAFEEWYNTEQRENKLKRILK